MKKRIEQLEAELRATKSVALSAIAAMESSASQFTTMASVKNLDPDGVRFVCASSATHLTKLAAEYTERIARLEDKIYE